MRRSDDNSVVQMSYWGCGFLFGALFTILLTSCGPFNYDPSPWCTTRDGKKDCTRASAERDSTTRADTSRKGVAGAPVSSSSTTQNTGEG